MKNYLAIGAILLGSIAPPLASQAAAACPPLPHTLTNGQIADASQVMNNLNSVNDCAGEKVDPGTEIIAGPGLQGGGALSQDVSLELSDTPVVPGSYNGANITVDAKGRITAASNGSGSGWAELTVSNPGGETGDTSGWTQVDGGFTASTANPSGHTMVPIEGSYAFLAAAAANPKMYQIIDLSSYATQIDAGKVSTTLAVYACDTFTIGELPIVYMQWRDAASNQRAVSLTSSPIRSIGAGAWRAQETTGRVPPGTRSMAIYVWANRADGTANNTAFDVVRAFVGID